MLFYPNSSSVEFGPVLKTSLLIVVGTQEEAAEAYDRAAIKYRGPAAVTNFELSRYPELFQ